VEDVSLAARVVEVITDLPPGSPAGHRYGSGCRVSGRLVLTAAHVVMGATGLRVRGPDKKLVQAVPVLVGDPATADLALIELVGDVAEVPRIPLAVVDKSSPGVAVVDRCHAVGYPKFKEYRDADGLIIRDTADVYGEIPVLSGLVRGLLTLQVSSCPDKLPDAGVPLRESQWSGISGAPVVADGCLLGVVSEHAQREGSSAISVVPLTAIDSGLPSPDLEAGIVGGSSWWRRLGVAGVESLRRLPVRQTRPEPAYRATVRTVHGRTPQLQGRESELDELAGFFTGPGGYRWLVGGAWAGKTAVVAEAITAAAPASVDVVAYFLSRREGDANSNRFLAAVVPQLCYLLDEDPPVPTREDFRDRLDRAAARAAERGRHLLLMVDGLDEDLRPVGVASVASLLPEQVAANAHVLVTSRPYPELPDDLWPGHPLQTTPPTELPPFPAAAHLAQLAQREIKSMLRGSDSALAAGVLGILTAAAGPLALDDLAVLTGSESDSEAQYWQVERLVTEQGARSLQQVGPASCPRYQFAHSSLLEQAQADRGLTQPRYRQRIERWADHWREAGWPAPAGEPGTTPSYLFDAYPATLRNQPQRLAALAGDVGWVATAVQAVGIDRLLADLDTAQSARTTTSASMPALSAAVRRQAANLRPPWPIDQPGYVLRQLCLQAAEFGEDQLAAGARARLQAMPSPGLVPLQSTRRASRALSVELDRHEGAVTAVTVLADGRVMTGGEDGRLLVSDLAFPARVSELGHHNANVRAAAGLPAGGVVSVGGDGRALKWDLGSPGTGPVLLGIFGTETAATIATIAVLPGGAMVSGGDDGRVLSWGPVTDGGDPVQLGCHDGRVAAVAALSDGRVVSADWEGQVLLWDPASPGSEPAELGRHDGTVRAVAVLPDGRVVSAGDDGRLMIWDPASPGADAAELGRRDGRLAAVAAAPGGAVVSGGDDGRVLLWDPASPGSEPAELGRHDGTVRAVAVLPDGRVVSGGDDGRALVWDPVSPDPSPLAPSPHDREAEAVLVLRDGSVASGGSDGRVLLWRPASPDGPAELGRHQSWVTALAELPDGRIVSAGDDGRILAWDPASPGTRPVALGRHGASVRAVVVVPDGRIISGGGDGRVLAWDPAPQGARGAGLVGSLDCSVLAAAALPDGRVVTGGSDGLVAVWDVTAGTDPIWLGRHDGWTEAVAALPDGRVVTGGSDELVLMWDVAPGTQPVELGRHAGNVRSIVVLPFGQVLSCGGDGKMCVWDVARVTGIAQTACSVTALAVAQNQAPGLRMASAHEGHGITVWSVDVRPG
jgi:WD40 repeat protein